MAGNANQCISVQEVIEDSLNTILRDSISLTAAGRTDTGVHARQMFAHLMQTLKRKNIKFSIRLKSISS